MVNIDVEREVLGNMCVFQECLVEGMARLRKEHFADPGNMSIFSLMEKMYNDGKHVDLTTVYQEGKAFFEQRSVTWLMLQNSCSSGAFNYLLDKIEKLYQTRCLHAVAKRIVQQINDGVEPEKIIQNIEPQVYVMAGPQQLKIVSPKEHGQRMLDTFNKRLEQKSNGGINTSYGVLNKLLNGGFEPGQLIIIGAKPGRGKTAFAMNVKRDISIVQKIPGLYINTEMSEEQMDIRWITILSNIDHYKVATGNLDDYEKTKAKKAMEAMYDSGFYSVTEPNLTMSSLVSICRRYVAQKKCKIVVVDYIGRMDTMDPRLREDQVLKNAAKKLKTLAQELNITVIMLAQINDEDRLKGSRGMEDESDFFGYLRELSNDEKIELPGANYVMIVNKNRSGPLGGIPFEFIGATMNFKGVEIKEEDKPSVPVDKKHPWTRGAKYKGA